MLTNLCQVSQLKPRGEKQSIAIKAGALSNSSLTDLSGVSVPYGPEDFWCLWLTTMSHLYECVGERNVTLTNEGSQ